jgi:putative colanic acid biosynthesis UDP-glucose lipid carrier transferase
MKGKYYSSILKVMIFIIDFCLINLAFTMIKMSGLTYGISPYEITSFFLVFSFIWIIAGFFSKIYRFSSQSITKDLRTSLFQAAVVHVLLVLVILTFFPVYRLSPEFLLSVYILSAILIIGSRVLFKLILKYFEFSGFDHRNVVIIGATRSGKAIYEFFSSQQAEGYEFKGFFDDDLDRAADVSPLILLLKED